MVDVYICTKAIHALWVDSFQVLSPTEEEKSSGEESAMSTDLSLQVAQAG